MYYKISKNSETGRKLEEIYKRAEKAHNTRNACMRELMEKFPGMTGKFREPGGYVISGGIHTVMFDENATVDPKVWIKKHENEYIPKRDSGVGKMIADLPTVKYTEINEVLNHKNPAHQFGLRTGDDVFGIEIDPAWKIEMPEDAEEILGSEYYSI